MNFVNLTSKPIHELTTGLQLPPAKEPVEATPVTIVDRIANGVGIYSTSFKPIKNLPDPKPDTIYIVSALALNSIPEDRTDFVSPGSVIKRNNEVIGCKGFRCR